MTSFFTPRSLRPSAPSGTRPSGGLATLQRATLEGLEVRDSTWDEWVACEAQHRAQNERPVPPAQPPRR